MIKNKPIMLKINGREENGKYTGLKLNPEDYKPSEKLKGLGKILSGATENRELLDLRARTLLAK